MPKPFLRASAFMGSLERNTSPKRCRAPRLVARQTCRRLRASAGLHSRPRTRARPHAATSAEISPPAGLFLPLGCLLGLKECNSAGSNAVLPE